MKTGRISTLAVDDDSYIYTAERTTHSLQKWLPGAKKPINLFEWRFQSIAIFCHSLSRALYFFYIFNGKPGVSKLVDQSSMPVNVFTTNGTGSALNQLGTNCHGLYVTSAGDIYVLDTDNNRVVKWAVNGISGIVVAGGNGRGRGSNYLVYPSELFVDQINDVLYVMDQINPRVQRYTNGSTNGVAVIGGGPAKVLSNVQSEYIDPISVLVDKMGNILVDERYKITKWTPNIKSSFVVTPRNNTDVDADAAHIYIQVIMTFDKLENLYGYDSGYEQVVKFNRSFTSCTTNLH